MTRRSLFLIVAAMGLMACVAGTLARADSGAASSSLPVMLAAAPAADEAPPVTPRTGPRNPAGRPDDWRPRPPVGGAEEGPTTRPGGAADRFHRMALLLARMKSATFNPAEAGLIAVGGLKDDVQRKDEEVITDLEQILAGTKSLGLRNAIRLQLRDLYKATNNSAKVLDHLRAMVKENDEALARLESSGKASMPEPPKAAP